MSAEDALAVCLLVILVLAGATLMTILVSMAKNAGKRDELAELMEEDEEEAPKDPRGEPAGGDKADEDNRQAWEKDSDWWKEKD